MSYLQQNTTPKPLTGAPDIFRGSVNLEHLSAQLFLELQLIKIHTHKGSDSRQLEADATPEMVRGYRPKEREEHGVAQWTGGASASGSVALVFGTVFSEAPDVFITPQDSNANIIVGTNSPSATGVTIYWKDDTGTTHTTLNLAWLAKAR